jgi:hypothetical protein
VHDESVRSLGPASREGHASLMEKVLLERNRGWDRITLRFCSATSGFQAGIVFLTATFGVLVAFTNAGRQWS